MDGWIMEKHLHNNVSNMKALVMYFQKTKKLKKCVTISCNISSPVFYSYWTIEVQGQPRK